MMNTKLEIGPGKAPIGPDWDTMNVVTTEFVPTYLHDMLSIPYPIEADRYRFIYASHVLEHAPWWHTQQVLDEWNRILEPGGRLDVCVPDFGKVIQAYLNPSLIKKHHPWFRNNPEKRPKLWVNGVIFAYCDSLRKGEENLHRACFDAEHLEDCLTRAKFVDIKPLDNPLTKNHGWINLGRTCVKR